VAGTVVEDGATVEEGSVVNVGLTAVVAVGVVSTAVVAVWARAGVHDKTLVRRTRTESQVMSDRFPRSRARPNMLLPPETIQITTTPIAHSR
jgi:hypothetical protein